jgi:hypothetical protein
MDTGSDSTKHWENWEYMDFELEVRKAGEGEYYSCVLNSPAGEPRARMHLPFDEGELKEKVWELKETLDRYETRSSAPARRRTHDLAEKTVREFGYKLLRALLDREVYTCYRMSLDKAKQQHKGLRLKLRVQPPELAELPWEFLYEPSQDEYLCLSVRRPLVRYLSLPQPVEPLMVEPPLRILGMVASPSDLPKLDIEHEKRRVDEAIKGLKANGLVELTWLQGETYEDLEQEMLDGPWHVFHFIGHGRFDQFRKVGTIALTDDGGHPHFLKARNLAPVLMDHYDLRLVFLNSCEGAKSSDSDAFSSTAATLVRKGMPAVVAMQYKITDEAAIEFARAFYRAVSRGLPADAAVAAGRISLNNKIDDTFEWATPVLYMHARDGRVFDVSEHEVIGNTKEAVSRPQKHTTPDNPIGRTEGENWSGDSSAVEVPDLRGQTVSRAISILDNSNLRLGMRNETLDQMASAGEIIEQDPSAGTEVEAGSSVNVTTSVRPSTKVPKIVGLRLPQARGELAAAGLKLGDENETPSETAPEGEIVGQYPMANTEARRDSFIRVSVSSGPNRVLGWRASGKIRALVDVSEHANSSDVSEEAKNAVAWDTEAENQDDRGGYKVFSAANLIVVVTWMIGVVVVLVILALIAR